MSAVYGRCFSVLRISSLSFFPIFFRSPLHLPLSRLLFRFSFNLHYFFVLFTYNILPCLRIFSFAFLSLSLLLPTKPLTPAPGNPPRLRNHKSLPILRAAPPQRHDLGLWANEIQDGMYVHQDPSTGLFHDYADNTSSFLEASSSVLMAASVYRNALLTGKVHHIPHAEAVRKALMSSNGTSVNGTTSYTPILIIRGG